MHVGWKRARPERLGEPRDRARDEWVRRSKARIVQQLDLAGEDHSIPDAELESSPEQDAPPVDADPPEWTTDLPEAAADANLSNWTD